MSASVTVQLLGTGCWVSHSLLSPSGVAFQSMRDRGGRERETEKREKRERRKGDREGE